MKAEVSKIVARNQSSPVDVRNIDQFTLGKSVEVDAGIVLETNWSLYCLDIENGRALFVETSDGTNLSNVPFVYAEQFAAAARAAIVKIEHLSKLSAQVAMPESVSILMSTGRCGSTLASRILARVPDVLSLSEPDWPTNLAFARQHIEDSDLRSLIASCARLTSNLSNQGPETTIVFKPRSEMMVQADAYMEALRGVNGVFLYRDCHGYVNSLYRFAQRVLGIKDPPRGTMEWNMVRELSTIGASEQFLYEYFGEDEVIEILDLITLGWTLRMRAYLNASTVRMRIIPVHYQDLVANQAEFAQKILEQCGISKQHLRTAISAFDVSSQRDAPGLNHNKGDPITEVQVRRVSELLKRWGWMDYENERLEPLVP